MTTLPHHRLRQIRRESKQRDSEFRKDDAGFCFGMALGILAVGLVGLLYMMVRHG